MWFGAPYLAAILAFRVKMDGYSIFSHLLSRCFLKGIFNLTQEISSALMGPAISSLMFDQVPI